MIDEFYEELEANGQITPEKIDMYCSRQKNFFIKPQTATSKLKKQLKLKDFRLMDVDPSSSYKSVVGLSQKQYMTSRSKYEDEQNKKQDELKGIEKLFR